MIKGKVNVNDNGNQGTCFADDNGNKNQGTCFADVNDNTFVELDLKILI